MLQLQPWFHYLLAAMVGGLGVGAACMHYSLAACGLVYGALGALLQAGLDKVRLPRVPTALVLAAAAMALAFVVEFTPLLVPGLLLGLLLALLVCSPYPHETFHVFAFLLTMCAVVVLLRQLLLAHQLEAACTSCMPPWAAFLPRTLLPATIAVWLWMHLFRRMEAARHDRQRMIDTLNDCKQQQERLDKDLTAAHQQLELERETASKKYNKLNIEFTKLRETHSRCAHEDTQRLQDAQQKHTDALAKLRRTHVDQMTKLQRELSEARKARDEKVRNEKQLLETLDQHQHKSGKLETKLKSLQDANTDLQKQLDTLQSQLANSSSSSDRQLAELNAAVTKANAEKKAATSKAESLEKDLKRLQLDSQAAMQPKNAKLQQLADQVQQLEAERDAANKQQHDLIKTLEDEVKAKDAGQKKKKRKEMKEERRRKQRL